MKKHSEETLAVLRAHAKRMESLDDSATLVMNMFDDNKGISEIYEAFYEIYADIEMSARDASRAVREAEAELNPPPVAPDAHGEASYEERFEAEEPEP